MRSLPFRHICLDFHTSPLIEDVGKDFDPDQFVATLTEARVNWITLHTKCHHGNYYYPTKLGRMHPGLTFDLFGKMLESCHRAGIRVEAYTTVVWDEWAAERHPEWLQIDAKGRQVGKGPMDLEGRWRWLCMASPYADLLAAQTEEILANYDPDGLLYDIVCQTRPACFCVHCMRAMKQAGINPADPEQAEAHSLAVERSFMARMSGIARAKKPDATLWFNVRTLRAHRPQDGIAAELSYLSHIELESLPSGIWGYNHFPLNVRYLQTLGVPIKGQTGRFHRSWGDFGGIKNLAALEYECFSMLAHGVQVSIGDQMHPSARLDAAVYKRIGSVFSRVEKMETYCRDAEPLADIAVLIATGARRDVDGGPSDEGAMRALAECHFQFQFVDRDADFQRWRLLIVPDVIRFDDALAAKVALFRAGGGKLLLSHESGLAADGARFALPEIGARMVGPAGFETTYFLPRGSVAEGIEDMPHVVYERGMDVEPLPNTEILADRIDPYFDRTWEHWCSHAQTPPHAGSACPSALLSAAGIAYIAFPVFRSYLQYASRPYRTLVRNCIQRLLPDPLVRAAAPSTARITILEQKDAARLVCHLLHYIPERRTKGGAGGWDAEIDIIEDVIPLYDVELEVRSVKPPRRVFLAPQETDIPFSHDQGYIKVSVPRVEGYQAVAFEF
jgi:hypothetical protein